jgi:hypothetical protein
MTMAASAATPILDFDFDYNNVGYVRDSVNNLVGSPAGEPPTSITDTPTGIAGDRAIQFEPGQYIRVEDPGTAMQLDPANPSFTLQAWVKFSGLPAGRMVFFYSNGPGGAISFSVTTDRSVFVTTLGILDANSTAVVPDDGQWHHIAVVHENGVELRYYVDGELLHTREYTSGVIFTRTQNFFTIGAEPGGGLQFVGALDRLKVTSGILTPQEMDFPATNQIVDTDGDGMPDWWEIEFGLDPTDPSDAALDCNGNGLSNLDMYLAGLDPCDTTPPTIVSASSTAAFDTVTLTFSEALKPATATALANYSISPSLAVTAAAYANGVVTLTTATQTPGTGYTVTVNNVEDLAGNAIAADSTIRFFSLVFATGVVQWERWNGGGAIDAFIQAFEAGTLPSPDVTWATSLFESGRDLGDNYRARGYAWFTPPQTGNYRFIITADDNARLFLSTDDNPANKLLTAAEGGWSNFRAWSDATDEQDSATWIENIGGAFGAPEWDDFPIPLQAGQRYYMEAFWQEGGGGDGCEVTWTFYGDPRPANGTVSALSGELVSSYAPAEGIFSSRIPAPNAQNVVPNTGITIVHVDGLTPWTVDNVSLKFNGVAVTPSVSKEGDTLRITYQPPSLLASLTTYTVTVGHPDPAGQPTETEWSFQTAAYVGPILDRVQGYPAILFGTAQQTPDQGGHTGAAGDFALDTGSAGSGLVPDATFLNAATADDTLSIAFFQKLRSVRASSSIWANSASSPSSNRGFQAHVPWSDSTIYFDTAGCCDANVTRINANISTFPDYTGEATWWQDWHHFAFVKDGAEKRIYINGKLFHSGGGSQPLPTDFTTFVMGGGSGIAENRVDGVLDDMVIYNGALTEAQALSLSSGAAPSSIPGLIAHWDFNEVTSIVQPRFTSIVKNADGSVTVTWEGTGVLEAAPTVSGPWEVVDGAASPLTLAPSEAMLYGRIRAN